MLDAIKKKLGITPDMNTQVVEAVVDTELAVAHAALGESFTKLQADFATLEAAFTEQTALHAEVVANLASATETIKEATAIVAEANAAKEAAEMVAKEMKMSARKATIVAQIGEGKADAFLAATEMLEDAAFESVASALAGSMTAEADTALFKEVGVDAKADPSKAVTESAEMQILKKKYIKAKPAK